MLDTMKLASKADAEELAEIVIRYAKKKGMTVRNIRDCIGEVETYMQNNATLEKEDSE